MNSKYLQMIAHGLILVAFMLAVIAAALWLRADPPETRAQAQVQSRGDGGGIPDPGKQRQETIQQLEAMNRHLANIEKGLSDGSFSFQVIEPKGAAKQARKDEAKE